MGGGVLDSLGKGGNVVLDSPFAELTAGVGDEAGRIHGEGTLMDVAAQHSEGVNRTGLPYPVPLQGNPTCLTRPTERTI